MTSTDTFIDKNGKKHINQYEMDKLLGRGSYAKVKLALNTEDSQHYAIKIQKTDKRSNNLLAQSHMHKSVWRQEIAIMKKIDHPNLVRLHEIIHNP